MHAGWTMKINDALPVKESAPQFRPWIDAYSQANDQRRTLAERGIQTPWPATDTKKVEVRSVAAKKLIYRAFDPLPGLPVMVEGWALCTKLTPDGRAQVVSLAMPGELVFATAAFSERLSIFIEAVTDVTIAFFDRRSFARSIENSAELLMKLQTAILAEQGHFLELLSDIGQRRADERVARLLLHLLERMQLRNAAPDLSFPMPLGARHVADMTGMTVAHANSIFTHFRWDEKLVHLQNKVITILDLPALARIAGESALVDHFRR